MQSLYINLGVNTFEFKASIDGAVAEGLIRYVVFFIYIIVILPKLTEFVLYHVSYRYHPFLYDCETFPSDKNDPRGKNSRIYVNDRKCHVTDDYIFFLVFYQQTLRTDSEHDYSMKTFMEHKPARGKRPMFECYWNGRLIPYTSIEELILINSILNCVM